MWRSKYRKSTRQTGVLSRLHRNLGLTQNQIFRIFLNLTCCHAGTTFFLWIYSEGALGTAHWILTFVIFQGLF